MLAAHGLQLTIGKLSSEMREMGDNKLVVNIQDGKTGVKSDITMTNWRGMGKHSVCIPS